MGKATVENHVKYLETHLVEKLRDDIYTNYESLNDAAKRIIAAINQRQFRKSGDIRGSRQKAFEQYDKPRMRPLPDGVYTLCDYKYVLRCQITIILSMMATITPYCTLIMESPQYSKQQCQKSVSVMRTTG